MTETAAKATFLTQEAYDRLKAELAELTGPARTEIAKKIEEARQEGDLRAVSYTHLTLPTSDLV